MRTDTGKEQLSALLDAAEIRSCEPMPDGSAGLSTLICMLGSDYRSQRVAAARALRDCGPGAVEHLCRVLDDSDRAVRHAATESLAALGDPRAIPALTQSLRRCLVGGSRWTHRMWIWASVAAVLLFVGFELGRAALGSWGTHLNQWVMLAVSFPHLVAGMTRICFYAGHDARKASLANAVAQIALYGGSREAWSALPELEILARTGWEKPSIGQSAMRKAIDVIRSTPEPEPHQIPSCAPDPDVDRLPIAGAASSCCGVLLPLPGENGGETT